MTATSRNFIWRPDNDLSAELPASEQKPPVERRRPSRQHRRRGKYRTRRKPHRRRPLSNEEMVQIRAEGYGRSYVQKQIRRKTPMVFELYGETVKGTIVRRLTYSLDIRINLDIRRIEKIDIKYMFKRDQGAKIAPCIRVDEAIRDQQFVSIECGCERYQVEDDVLANCHKKRIPVTLTLRSGEMITGLIDWFSKYDIKINFAPSRGVVVFRHGIHHFAVASELT